MHYEHAYQDKVSVSENLSFEGAKAARLAQSVEHETLNLRVVGSSPTLGAILNLWTFLRGLVSFKQVHLT